MNTLEAIRLKRAVRKFNGEPLPEEVVLSILDAGRHAQSSKNTQPWQFIALRDKGRLAALSECGTWATHLAGAALGVAIVTADPGAHFQTLFDAGQAAAYMQLAALEFGVGSCLASIYDQEKARSLLDYPMDMFLHIAISFGYPADPDELNRPPHKDGRHDLNEVIHWESW